MHKWSRDVRIFYSALYSLSYDEYNILKCS